MKPTSVSVSFRKQLSDGNYGSEVGEVMLNFEVDEADGLVDGDVQELLAKARAAVHGELLRSPSVTVRRALEPAKPRPAPGEDDVSAEDLPF
jgi:hypothetical protein